MTNIQHTSHQEHLPGAIEVKPIAYRRPMRKNIALKGVIVRTIFLFGVPAIVFALMAAIGFSFLSLPTRFIIDPKPDILDLQGGWLRPKIGDTHLLLSGKYEVKVMKQGYETLVESIQVQAGGINEFRYTLTPLPGSLWIHAIDAKSGLPIAEVPVLINGKIVGETPIEKFQVMPGTYEVRAEAPRYLPITTHVDIIGKEEKQHITLEFNPAWSEVSIPLGPAGATVFVNGKSIGKIPLKFQHDSGVCHLTVTKEKFESLVIELELKPGETRILPEVSLEPKKGEVHITTTPPQAHVLVNSKFVGLSPIKLKVKPEKIQEITLMKPGFESFTTNMEVKSGEISSLEFVLQAVYGQVNLEIVPPDAEVLIDGVQQERSDSLVLTNMEHSIVVRKKGFQTCTKTFLPVPNHPLHLKIELQDEKSLIEKFPTELVLKNGYSMKLIIPEGSSFMLGSSRSEPHRRSNETLRKVKLKRPFLIGVREVSNKQFKEFDSSHYSGQGLDGDQQPVVNITWNQAAKYCNWLCEKEGIPPSYQVVDGYMILSKPPGLGYRLPSEAEWSYCLRTGASHHDMYPWGKKWPPENVFANLADEAANHLGFPIVENYKDGYPQSVAPGTFAANSLGLFDLVGNVAEWCHDYYGIYPYNPTTVEVDPLGPNSGLHHVIRGSSWRHGKPTQLRLAFRDYSNDRRNDTGFRICKYAVPDLQSQGTVNK